MASENEFWVPTELALDILGFNKNILEKRINADFIKKEIRSGIELLEISGEIERFGLSLQIAKEKLSKYLDNGQSKPSGSPSVVPKEAEVYVAKPASSSHTQFYARSPKLGASASAPISTSVSTGSHDYSQHFSRLIQTLEDLRKLVSNIPDSVVSKSPRESQIPTSQMSEIKADFVRVIGLLEQNEILQKEVTALQAQLSSAKVEVAKINTQANSVMDELERTNQKYGKEIENLKAMIKTDTANLHTLLNVKLKPKKSIGVVLLLLLLVGGVGFVVYELMQPTYTVLANSNDKINPLSKNDVVAVVKEELQNTEAAVKSLVANEETNREDRKKTAEAINTLSGSALESLKVQLNKLVDTINGMKEGKAGIDDQVSKSLKTLETKINELEKQIKKLSESAVTIKPGTEFIKDSTE